MSEEKLEKEFEVYKQIAKEDKKIDVAALMINALQKHEANLLPEKQKRWAYLISLTVPPVGLFFALKFYLQDKDDAKEAALMCLVLTALSILLTVLFTKALLSSSGTNLNQIQQIKPADIQQLYQ
jgi:hypothetical protein